MRSRHRGYRHRYVLGLVLFVIAVGGATGAFWQAQAQDKKDPLRTETRETPPGVYVKECHIVLIHGVSLSCDRSGILKSMDVKEGDRVTAKQRVALIDDGVAQAVVKLAEKKADNEKEIESKRALAEAAKEEYQRSKDTNDKREKEMKPAVIPVMEVIKFGFNAKKTACDVEQSEHEHEMNKLELAKAKAELATYSVLAEFEGVVTQIYKKPGESVRQGDPIVKLINTDRVRIEGKVRLDDLRYAKPGAKVVVRLSLSKDVDLPEKLLDFEGKLVFVDLESDLVKNETKVIAEVENPDNFLRAGLKAEMYLQKE